MTGNTKLVKIDDVSLNYLLGIGCHRQNKNRRNIKQILPDWSMESKPKQICTYVAFSLYISFQDPFMLVTTLKEIKLTISRPLTFQARVLYKFHSHCSLFGWDGGKLIIVFGVHGFSFQTCISHKKQRSVNVEATVGQAGGRWQQQ